MIKRLRINAIKSLLELNEKLVFNRRLAKFYKDEFEHGPSYVIDVGANMGQSIDLFLKINRGCKIVGFEPIPKLFGFLKDRYSDNPNVSLYQKGISNREGHRLFFENTLQSTSTFEELNVHSKYLRTKAKILGVKRKDIVLRSYQVETTTLANFVNSNCNSNIDLIKIDTEGHEQYCLEGLFSGRLDVEVKYIQIEEHNDDMYLNKKSFNAIEELLSLNGYRVLTKIDHGFGKIQDVIFGKI
jgi:FkbM family methyltransferase